MVEGSKNGNYHRFKILRLDRVDTLMVEFMVIIIKYYCPPWVENDKCLSCKV